MLVTACVRDDIKGRVCEVAGNLVQQLTWLSAMQVRDARAGFAKPSRKRNPLKNLGTMLKLNPYVAQVSFPHRRSP